MPGLLHTEATSTGRLYAAIAAEFICTFLFAFIGGAAPGSVAAPANGIALAVLGGYPAGYTPVRPRWLSNLLVYHVLSTIQVTSTCAVYISCPAVYVAANVSGGHLNPAGKQWHPVSALLTDLQTRCCHTFNACCMVDGS